MGARRVVSLALQAALLLAVAPLWTCSQLTGSLTAGASVALSSNNNSGARAAIIDGNDNSGWQSDACFPYQYTTRSDVNILLSWCSTSPSSCTASAGSTTLSQATDSSLAWANWANIKTSSPTGQATLRIALPGSGTRPLRRVDVRLASVPAPINFTIETASGELIPAGALDSSAAWTWAGVRGPWARAVAVTLSSSASFLVSEIAATSALCSEQATIDLGGPRDLGSIRVKHWGGGDALNSTLLYSTDGVNFTALVTLDVNRVEAQTYRQVPALRARYLAVRHTVRDNDWAKVYVWGIDAFAPPPSPPPSPSPPPPSPPPPSPPPATPGWDTLAGTVESMTKGRPVTVNSGADPAVLAHIVDGVDSTQWQTDACYPVGYIGRADMNPILNACATPAGGCTASPGTALLADATDNNVYTGAFVANATGGGFVRVPLPAPATVARVNLKGFGTAPLVAFLEQGNGTRTQVVVLDSSTQNYQWVVAQGSWDGVTAVRVESVVGFTLTEVAVQAGPCTQWASVDMGQVNQVGMIRVRFWAPIDASTTNLLTSTDGIAWSTLKTYATSTLPAVEHWFPSLTPVRFIKLLHNIADTKDWVKAYYWGIEAYDQWGRWGPPPPPEPSPVSLRRLFGVNGIWGWGFNAGSDSLVKSGKGPVMYNQAAGAGRNYHEMLWDVRWPTHDPHYNEMKTRGTDGQWWLDWDKEYSTWQSAGLPVSASFQFQWDVFGPWTWGDDPYTTAYNLGFKFAAHFGPTNGTGTVDSVEFGNEPWAYFTAAWYSTALRGWIDGARAGDPALKRLPCALQADSPQAEGDNGGNFIGARVAPDVAPHLHALNHHTYSYFTADNGSYIAVHPEHWGSTFNGLNNFMAWRTANTPDKPVWVTEWGWDAHLPGEACNSTQCVSQYAQAVYAIRGLMILARKGVAQSHWFFYANGDKCSSLFCRSGLRGANNTGFPELPVYRAVRGLMQLVGASAFAGIAAESPDLFAYTLGPPNGGGEPTHVIAWRPVEAGEAPESPTTLQLPLAAAGLAGRAPQQAWVFDGQGTNGYAAAAALPAPSASGDTWAVAVSTSPLLVQLA